jgi:HEAT repeat protein
MRKTARRSSRVLLAVAGVIALAVSVAVGHGGGHEPPPPPEPPGPPWNGGPEDGPGVPGRPPNTPGRGGGAGPSAPGPSGPAQPTPASGPRTLPPGGGLDPTRWNLWWKFNQHEFIDLKDAVWTIPVESGTDDGFFLGHGTQKLLPAALRPSEEQLTEKVIPALIAVLKREGQPQVLSGCLMALAKIGDLPVEGDDTAEVIAGFLDDPNQQMCETAALALGILGRPSSLLDLGSLVADDERGRKLVGRSRVPVRTRTFAAFGIGMLASECENPDVRRFAVHRLTDSLVNDETASHDLGVGLVNALSMAELSSRPEHLLAEEAPPPSASREGLLRFLLERFDDKKLEEMVRAHLPRAMARIAAPEQGPGGSEEARTAVGTALIRAIGNSRTRREVVYGCAIGLGRLGNASRSQLDIDIVDALEKTVVNGDTTARNLSLLALGRISSRPGARGGIEQLPSISKLLLRTLTRGKSRTRPWAALALGVQGFRLRRLDLVPSTDVDHALRGAFEECGSPDDVGAYALALGLRGDIGASQLMMTRIYRFRDDLARGPIALALGMTGDQTGIEFLYPFLPEAAYRPDFLRPMVIALALLGDKTLVPTLVSKIEESKSSAVKSVYAWALAHVGDSRAVDPILSMLGDESLPNLARGIAALGAGFIAERNSKPWNAALTVGVNYLASPDTLYAPAGGGVLNIR